MVSNDDFDGKASNLNYFYLHINFEQKNPKPAIVKMSWHKWKEHINTEVERPIKVHKI